MAEPEAATEPQNVAEAPQERHPSQIDSVDGGSQVIASIAEADAPRVTALPGSGRAEKDSDEDGGANATLRESANRESADEADGLNIATPLINDTPPAEPGYSPEPAADSEGPPEGQPSQTDFGDSGRQIRGSLWERLGSRETASQKLWGGDELNEKDGADIATLRERANREPMDVADEPNKAILLASDTTPAEAGYSSEPPIDLEDPPESRPSRTEFADGGSQIRGNVAERIGSREMPMQEPEGAEEASDEEGTNAALRESANRGSADEADGLKIATPRLSGMHPAEPPYSPKPPIDSEIPPESRPSRTEFADGGSQIRGNVAERIGSREMAMQEPEGAEEASDEEGTNAALRESANRGSADEADGLKIATPRLSGMHPAEPPYSPKPPIDSEIPPEGQPSQTDFGNGGSQIRGNLAERIGSREMPMQEPEGAEEASDEEGTNAILRESANRGSADEADGLKIATPRLSGMHPAEPPYSPKPPIDSEIPPEGQPSQTDFGDGGSQSRHGLVELTGSRETSVQQTTSPVAPGEEDGTSVRKLHAAADKEVHELASRSDIEIPLVTGEKTERLGCSGLNGSASGLRRRSRRTSSLLQQSHPGGNEGLLVDIGQAPSNEFSGVQDATPLEEQYKEPDNSSVLPWEASEDSSETQHELTDEALEDRKRDKSKQSVETEASTKDATC